MRAASALDSVCKGDYSIFSNVFYTLWFRLRINNLIFSGSCLCTVHVRQTVAHTNSTNGGRKETTDISVKSHTVPISLFVWAILFASIDSHPLIQCKPNALKNAVCLHWQSHTYLQYIFEMSNMYQFYVFSCWRTQINQVHVIQKRNSW